MIPKEETENIKKQIIEQIGENIPQDRKEIFIKQIESMTSEQLEEFIERNKSAAKNTAQESKCIFCSIIFNEIPSYKIDENPSALAVLEINPVSKAHSIIIPKEHKLNDESRENALSLAKKIADKIKSKFSPKEVKIKGSEMFGHEILNVFPVYDNETLESKRNPAKKSDLEEMQKALISEEKPKAKKKETVKKSRVKKINEKNLWLPRRIP